MNIDKEVKLIVKDFPKKRSELRAYMYIELFNRIDKLFETLDGIQGREYIDKYMALLSHVLPKMSEENFQFDGEAPVLRFEVVDKLTNLDVKKEQLTMIDEFEE